MQHGCTASLYAHRPIVCDLSTREVGRVLPSLHAYPTAFPRTLLYPARASRDCSVSDHDWCENWRADLEILFMVQVAMIDANLVAIKPHMNLLNRSIGYIHL